MELAEAVTPLDVREPGDYQPGPPGPVHVPPASSGEMALAILGECGYWSPYESERKHGTLERPESQSMG